MNTEIKEFKDFSGGINQSNTDWSIADNEAIDITNFEFSPIGALVKRLGCTQINSTELTWAEHTSPAVYISNKIWHLHKFYNNIGSEYNLVWAHFETGTTAFVAILRWDGVTFTHLEIIDLGTGTTKCKLDKDAYIFSTVVDNKLVFVNGVNLAYWYDYVTDTVKRLGILAPGTVTGVDNPAGGSMSDGTYKYKVTWKNALDNIESAPCSVCEVIVNGGGVVQSVTLTIPACSDTNVDSMCIYRTIAGGNDYYKVVEITPDAISYIDTMSDATLITNASYDTDVDDNQPPPDAPDYCFEFQNRLFLIKNNVLYFSKIGEPDYFPTLNYIDIGDTDANACRGLFEMNGSLWIAYQNGFRKANCIGITTSWSIDELMNGPGVFSDRSIKVVDGLPVPVGEDEVGEIIYAGRGAMVYLSYAGQVWAFDGYRFHYVGEKVEKLIKDIPSETLVHAPAVYYPNKHQYKISFDDIVLGLGTDIPGGGSAGPPYNNKTMVFDVKHRAWTKENRIFECADAHTGGDDTGELWVGSAGRGFIYQQDTGGTDTLSNNTTDISARFESKQYSFGKVNQNKRFRKIYLDAFGDSAIRTTININRGKVTFGISNTITDAGTVTVWAEPEGILPNIGTWDLLASPIFVANINGSLGTGAYKYKYKFRNPNLTGAYAQVITSASYASASMSSLANPNDGITIQIPADTTSYNQGFTQFCVLRTKVGGTTFYYEVIGTWSTRNAAGAATNYNSTIADASLGQELETEPPVLVWGENGQLEHFENFLNRNMVGRLIQFIFETEDNDETLQIMGLGIALKPQTQH